MDIWAVDFENLRVNRDDYRYPANVPRLARAVSRQSGVVGPSGASRIRYTPILHRRHPSYASERTVLGY